MGIGVILQNLLTEKGKNVNEVANEAGVKAQTLYSIIKRDSMSVNIQDLCKVAHCLGVTLDYFYNLTCGESPKPSRALSDDSQLRLLIENYLELNQEGREKIVIYSQDLKDGGRYKKPDPHGMDKEA